MKTSKQEMLMTDDDVVIGIKVTKFDDGIESERFIIPIVDVRNGEKSREKVDAMIKQNNIQRGSKFFKPSYSVIGISYNSKFKDKE